MTSIAAPGSRQTSPNGTAHPSIICGNHPKTSHTVHRISLDFIQYNQQIWAWQQEPWP
ncbi:hypothetical protein Vi05172_g3861 [Venturia inaequalis]|nr:hypothetical protein Vi05172_g3861 [Venturia inaequalis]